MAERIDLDDESAALLAARYRAGVSVKALAVERGVARAVVRRWLVETGVPVRGRSAAMHVRMAATSPAERARLTAAANEAARGRTASLAERASRAVTIAPRDTWVGMGEGEAAIGLTERGLVVAHQAPVGPYNVDLAVGRVAIEVHRNTNYPLSLPHIAERVAFLRHEGWAVVYLWCARGARERGRSCVEAAALDRVAALTASGPGSFHVVRCTGEDATRAA